MIFNTTPIPGVWLIGLKRIEDQRGSFARAFCANEFANHGLETGFVQANMGSSSYVGTVRGMHYQRAPNEEVKIIRCVAGVVYDVVVDVREDSPTYLQWFGAELSAGNGLMMYVPRGFAHGYQALTDGAMTHYMVSAFYSPDSEAGLRHDDPAVGIVWPVPVTDLSPKDRSWPLVNRDAL